MTTLLKYYDLSSSSYKIAKGIKYYDENNTTWEYPKGDGTDNVGGFRYYNKANDCWVPIDARQPQLLNHIIGSSDLYHTLALWHFDENDDTIIDYSGHGLDLSRTRYAQSPAWSSNGYFNTYCLRFTDDRLTASSGKFTSLSNSHNWQIDVVFKLSGSAPSDNKVFFGTYTGCQIWVGTHGGSGGKLEIDIRDNDGAYDYLLGTSNVYDSKWHKATFVRYSEHLYIYKDGELENSKEDNNEGGYSIVDWNIGWLNTGDFPKYALDDCLIDEIRLLKIKSPNQPSIVSLSG
jgi:hypothetical protein